MTRLEISNAVESGERVYIGNRNHWIYATEPRGVYVTNGRVSFTVEWGEIDTNQNWQAFQEETAA